MAEPTALHDVIQSWNAGLPGRRIFVPPPATPTTTADIARQLEERRADVVQIANARCDERFPKRYTAASTTRPDVLRWVKTFHTDREAAPSLLLNGPTGTGKTWQAYAALRLAVCEPYEMPSVGYRAPDWRAVTHADLLAKLRPSNRNDSEQLLATHLTLPLLLVDDLGVAKQSEWVEDITYRLINGRYNDMRPTIYTTNLAPRELRDAVGERIASRLIEMCVRITCAGDDRRRQLAPAKEDS